MRKYDYTERQCTYIQICCTINTRAKAIKICLITNKIELRLFLSRICSAETKLSRKCNFYYILPFIYVLFFNVHIYFFANGLANHHQDQPAK